jgi:hypothetical protein
MNINIRIETIEDMLDLKDLLNRLNYKNTNDIRNKLCILRSKINKKRYESDDYNYFFSMLEDKLDNLEICNLCKNYYCNNSTCHLYKDTNEYYEKEYTYHETSDDDYENEYNTNDHLVEDIYLYDDPDY